MSAFSSRILATPSLRAYYRLSDPGTTAAELAFGLSGAYNEATPAHVAGSITDDDDTAYVSAGAASGERVILPAGLTIPLNSPITISYAVYVATADIGASVNPTAFSIGDLDNPDRCLAHTPYTDGNVYWDYGTSAGAGRISAGGFPLDRWVLVHLVSSGTANTFKAIYWDGALKNSAASSTGPSQALSGGFIAFKTGLTGIKGRLDEFQVYTAMLDAQTIQEHYAAWLRGGCQQLDYSQFPKDVLRRAAR